MLAQAIQRESRSERSHKRAFIATLWLEWRVTAQTSVGSDRGIDECIANWRGAPKWWKNEELGLGIDQSPDIFHTTSNLDATNRRNRADFARRENEDTAERRQVEAPTQRPRRDVKTRDKAVRRLMLSAGMKVRGGQLVRCS